MQIETGDPVILIDAKGLKKYGLHKGMKGMCNMCTTIPDDGDYIHFMPDGIVKVFVIRVERCVLDEERMKELENEFGEKDSEVGSEGS